MWRVLPDGGRELALDMDLLEMLSKLGMSDREIGVHLNCSPQTVWRKRTAAGIPKRDYLEIDNSTLIEVSTSLRVDAE
jgi:hypothetical protein